MSAFERTSKIASRFVLKYFRCVHTSCLPTSTPRRPSKLSEPASIAGTLFGKMGDMSTPVHPVATPLRIASRSRLECRSPRSRERGSTTLGRRTYYQNIAGSSPGRTRLRNWASCSHPDASMSTLFATLVSLNNPVYLNFLSGPA